MSKIFNAYTQEHRHTKKNNNRAKEIYKFLAYNY
jgi:hypothetical protein